MNRVMFLSQRAVLAAALLLLALAPAAHAQTETVLFNFYQSTGENPNSGLIADSSGNLYGTTESFFYPEHPEDGVVYELDHTGHYTVLHLFPQSYGSSPFGVVRDASGSLYGITGGGGLNGTIYKIDSGGQFTVLHSFTGIDGNSPVSVSLDAAGDLYGTTVYGGAYDSGVLFELDVSGQFTVLDNFTGGADGGYPVSRLVRDAAGNLYGATSSGGATNRGVVYKFDPQGRETVLHSFLGVRGDISPSVILDDSGNLFGTGRGGGSGCGIVFKLDPSGNQTVLHEFSGNPDGCQPAADSLAFDTSGNLYGFTTYGGAANTGAVFKIDRQTAQESVLYSFGPYFSGDANSPLYGPPLIINGNIYGATLYGGKYDVGAIFKVTTGQ